MKRFKTPKQWLGDLDAEEAATLIEAAADIALVLDNAGVIRDVAFAQEDLAREFASVWLNRSWIDVASIDTKVKAEALLRDAPTPGARRWRHINHPASRGPDVPILYAAMPFGKEGRNLIVGRDLRPIAILQQRLVDAQQSMERDYSRLRDIETRYRQLFHTAVEAMLVVDAGSNRLTETNPAAEKLLATSNSGLIGQPFANCFDSQAAGTVLDLLASARPPAGRRRPGPLAGGGPEIMVSCTLYRQESSTFLLVRLAPQGVLAAPTPMADDRTKLLSAVEKAPDAFVVTGPDGRILDVNAAFLDMVQLATDDQAKGESLDRWLGRPGVDLSVLLASLRQHGMVRLFATTLRGGMGPTPKSRSRPRQLRTAVSPGSLS